MSANADGEWFDNPTIMAWWDSWRRYIAGGGQSSWPRDAFESLLDTHDEQVATLRAERDAALAEVERLRSAAGYQAEAHTLRTSQKLLAELVRSWGYENRPNESNGAMIRRVLEDGHAALAEVGRLRGALETILKTGMWDRMHKIARAALKEPTP